MTRFPAIVCLCLTGASVSVMAEPPQGMVWIEGGEFAMGSDAPWARADEAPVHRVAVDGFWMDEAEVTNARFAAFVEATGYVTVAERPVDWEELKQQLPPGTPKPDDEVLAPGSLVFKSPGRAVALNNVSAWWVWTHGADWRHPEGPDSTIDDKANHPVVHVAHEDALAYCEWADVRLPTEAQWEWAARGGLENSKFCWGDDPVTPKLANIWQGDFPATNTAADGFETTAPVRTFPANPFGLFDMAGNVWEWTADWYRPDTYAARAHAMGDNAASNPPGPESSFDPTEPLAAKRTIRGGSFLCHASYCESYRPSARMRTTADTSMSHVGFRCVKQDADPKQTEVSKPAPKD